MYHLAAELAHEHPPFKTHSIISYSSSVSLYLAIISPIPNPLLQTMSAAAVTAASTSPKTDTSYLDIMDVPGLSEGRVDQREE